MYTKEQLEKLAIPELMEIANQLGVKVSQDDTMEHVIYEILDKTVCELKDMWKNCFVDLHIFVLLF